ncbi:hypothetical protein BGX24_005116 [Mortierella sp. AD032]|nr:hypothetical protein BGX24_005116 [Mortierella sp. AD032]
MTNATVQERQFEYEYPVIVGIDFGLRAKNYVLLSEFKLQLDETVNLPPLENNITPLKAITDYLRKLHENTVEELMDLPTYTSSDFQYWLTVPAHWSDRAKDTMRQAAIGAGFVKSSDPPRRLMFISEDEATAFFCAGSTDQVRFIAKDRLMIYRASEGKGINLVMLEVSDSSAVQSQRWKEVARRHGTDCVSTSLDDNMKRFLEGKLRKYIDNLPANAMGKLMDTFRDSLKGNFLGIVDHYLPVPPGIGLDDNDLDAGIDGGYLVLSALELKAKVFEPVAAGVLEPIRTMLEQQPVRECKAVFMFGDLGVSQYLLERVRQEFRDQIVLVTVPMGQDAAIANGATFSPSNSSSTPATHTNVQAQHVYPLVMAIDFGMKFSKVSYAARKDKGEMYDQYNWPYAVYQSEQTPVISLYKKGSTEIQDWGLKAREEMKNSPQDYYLLSNLRLQLDESIDVPPFGNGITPLKAITDYLKKLHEYVLLQWNMSFAEDRDSRHIQYCLTVPARWSIRSKNTMRQAAINAGMVQAGDPCSHLMLLSEDEAMATYCTRRIDGVQFKDKEQFIICNAGEGGGVDVVAFEVNEPAGQTRRLKEIARMCSETCGLDFLEANIENYLERKLRKFRGKIPAHGWEDCMSYFKYDMQSTFSLEDEHCYLPIPEFFGMDSLKDLDIGLEDGMLCLPVEELKLEVFEPAVGDVLELIQDLMQSQQRLGGKGKAIFMLGEFGSCQYMLERARQEFKDHVELVAAPVRPSMAVSRGAVYMGLDS